MKKNSVPHTETYRYPAGARRAAGFRLLFKSAVFRLAFLMFVIIVPICILTMIMSGRAIRMAENQVSGDIQEALNLNMNQLDNYLRNIGRRLYTVSRGNDDYARLMTASSPQAGDIEMMHAYMRLKNVFAEIPSEYTWADNVMAWFPDHDYYISSGSYQTEVGKELFEEIIAAELDGRDSQWFVPASHPDLLVGIFQYRNTYYGAAFLLEHLLDNMIQTEADAGMVALAGRGTGILAGPEDLRAPDGQFFRQNGPDLSSGKQVSVKGETYILLASESSHSDLVLIDLVSRSMLDNTLPGFMRILFLLSIVFLVCIPVLFIAFRRWLVRPVNMLTEAIHSVDGGDLDYRIEERAGTYEFDLLNQNFNEMMDSVKDLKIHVYEQELERQDIRLQYLSQQIQPHFILNAMNIIYSYEPEEYDLIQKMVLCLSRYFQFIVNASRPYVRIWEEMDHISNYLQIQQIRYGERIRYQVVTQEEAGEAVMPPLMVQNLVENVIKYALRDDETVNVEVAASCDGQQVTVMVRDTGYGIKDDTLEQIRRFRDTGVRQEGLGIGIQNTIERLKLFFGEEARFEAGRWNHDEGTQILLTFPARYDTPQEDSGAAGEESRIV